MEIDMLVEVPAGSRNKYELDHETGRIKLDRPLFTATRYPADYGYLPGSWAEDDDPLDVLVLLDEPTFPGCQVRVRVIGVFWMSDEHGPDAKVLGVAVGDRRAENVFDISDVPHYVLDEIGHFFDVYKQLEPSKQTETRGWEGREAAEKVVEEALQRGKERESS